MNAEPLSPDEFARLLSLPGEDPERRRAESLPQFAAMRRMLAEFERRDPASVEGARVEVAKRELAVRLDALGVPFASREAARAGSSPEARAQRDWTKTLFGWMHQPAARSGLAFAALLMFATFVWWSQSRTPAPGVVRGGGEAPAFELRAPRFEPGGVMLSWSAVPGAESYRVVFYGPDLSEVAHRDVNAALSLELSAGKLPDGLHSGEHVAIAIEALRGPDVIATSKSRAIPLP